MEATLLESAASCWVMVLCELALGRREVPGVGDTTGVARVLVSQGGRVVVTLEMALSSDMVAALRLVGVGPACLRLAGRAAAFAGESSLTSLVPNFALADDSRPYALGPIGVGRLPPLMAAVPFVLLLFADGFWTVILSAPQ